MIIKYSINKIPSMVFNSFPPRNSLISKMSLLPNGFHSFKIRPKNKKTKMVMKMIFKGEEEPQCSNIFCGRFNTRWFNIMIKIKAIPSTVPSFELLIKKHPF